MLFCRFHGYWGLEGKVQRNSAAQVISSEVLHATVSKQL